GNSHRTEASKPGSSSSSPSRYFQSMRARTASAARRSARSSRNWSRVTSARRHGASPGWPRSGKRSAKSSSRKTAPSSSRSFRSGSPLRKAARATRAVASGTGSMGLGLRDMVDLSGGSAADSHDIGPPAGPARFRQQYPADGSSLWLLPCYRLCPSAWEGDGMAEMPRSLPEFEARFPDEAACARWLLEKRWPDGFRCPACGHGEAWELGRERLTLQCTACERQVSVTAGTVLHGSHLSLRTWFLAAWLMATHANGISARQLWRQLAPAPYQSAWL